MLNNVKFVLSDEDIQVRWGQLVFRFIPGVGVCAFPHVLGMEESKKIAATFPEDNFWNSPQQDSVINNEATDTFLGTQVGAKDGTFSVVCLFVSMVNLELSEISP